MNNTIKAFLWWILPGFLIAVTLTYFLLPEPSFRSNEDRAAFAHQFLEGADACEVYAEVLANDPGNSAYQLAFAESWATADRKERAFLRNKLVAAGLFPIDRYEQDLQQTDPTLRNAAHFGTAALTYYQEQVVQCALHLDSIDDPQYTGRELMYGMLAGYNHQTEKAIYHYQQEIANNGIVARAAKPLFPLLVITGRKAEAKQMITDPRAEIAVAQSWRRYLSFTEGRVLDYLAEIPQIVSRQFNVWGSTAAFVVMLIWCFFLFKLARLSKSSKVVGVLAILGGMLTVGPVLIGYDFADWVLDASAGMSVMSKLTHTVFVVGLLEETGKLLPLVLLRFIFPKHFQTPMDYVLVAALSGLGFAFVEDTIYFTSKSLDIISARSLVAGPLHMAWSSLAVYGFVQWRFREPGVKALVAVAAYFLLAVLLHGLYDFWLLRSTLFPFWILSIGIMVGSTIAWGQIMNNALNNSGAYDNRSLLNIGRLNTQLLGLFCGIIFLEFFVNGWVFGSKNALVVLLDGLKVGLCFVPFLAYQLSRINLAPHGWQAVDVVSSSATYDLQGILQKQFRLEPYRNFGTIAQLLPMTGTITERVTIANDVNWFLFVPDPAFQNKFKNVAGLLLKTKNKADDLQQAGVLVHVRIVKELEAIKSKNSKLTDFPFVDWGELYSAET